MQISTKPQPTKKLIDATVPGENPTSPVKNISQEEQKRLHAEWDRKAADRAAQVAKETAQPSIPSKILRFELRKYGRHWNAYYIDGKRSATLMPAPSLLTSALEAVEEAMHQLAIRQ